MIDENKINIAIVEQLKLLYNFNNTELKNFYKALKKISLKQKNDLLIDFNNKIKKRKKSLNNLLINLKINNNKIEELKEKMIFNKNEINNIF